VLATTRIHADVCTDARERHKLRCGNGCSGCPHRRYLPSWCSRWLRERSTSQLTAGTSSFSAASKETPLPTRPWRTTFQNTRGETHALPRSSFSRAHPSGQPPAAPPERDLRAGERQDAAGRRRGRHVVRLEVDARGRVRVVGQRLEHPSDDLPARLRVTRRAGRLRARADSRGRAGGRATPGGSSWRWPRSSPRSPGTSAPAPARRLRLNGFFSPPHTVNPLPPQQNNLPARAAAAGSARARAPGARAGRRGASLDDGHGLAAAGQPDLLLQKPRAPLQRRTLTRRRQLDRALPARAA
jgi:hypothetical protein